MNHIQTLVQDFQSRHFPDGNCKLMSSQEFEESSYYSLFNISTTVEEMVLEKEDAICLISKLTDKVFLEISVDHKSYNIGILKSLNRKLTEKLRNNSLASVE